ncbi:MAG: hypothetical protein ABR575_00775 [Actinomycetota bacterium]
MRPAESGQAVIETLLMGLLLLVPLIWMIAVLADVHRAALATTAAAREAGADAVRSADLVLARRAVDVAVAHALDDHGFSPRSADVRLDVERDLARGSAVEVEVSIPVTVVKFPLLGSVSGPAVHVRARYVARVDPYRSRG